MTGNHNFEEKTSMFFLWAPQNRSWGWSGVAKVSCILRHQGVQLILAYSWARPATLVAGKGRGGMFLFLLFPVPFSPLSFSFIFTVSSITLLPFSGRPHKMSPKDWCVVNPNTINQTEVNPYSTNHSNQYIYIYIYIYRLDIYCESSADDSHIMSNLTFSKK